MITIIDDFLDKDDFEKLKTFYEGGKVRWSYLPTQVYLYEQEQETFQFVDVVYNHETREHTETLHEYFVPVLKKLNAKALVRLKVNLTTITDKPSKSILHTDFTDIVCKTAILYINTNNGYTIFENGVSVNSVANRVVLFDSNLNHTGVSTTDQKVRLVANINYYDNMELVEDPKGEIAL